jgi:hypothetical protein
MAMNIGSSKGVAQVVLVALAVIALLDANSEQLTTAVNVKVQMASSSGVCSLLTGTPELAVICGTGKGSVVTRPGGAIMQRVATIPSLSVGSEPVPLYSDVKISSWRIVKLDNSDYVELTVAW